MQDSTAQHTPNPSKDVGCRWLVLGVSAGLVAAPLTSHHEPLGGPGAALQVCNTLYRMHPWFLISSSRSCRGLGHSYPDETRPGQSGWPFGDPGWTHLLESHLPNKLEARHNHT